MGHIHLKYIILLNREIAHIHFPTADYRDFNSECCLISYCNTRFEIPICNFLFTDKIPDGVRLCKRCKAIMNKVDSLPQGYFDKLRYEDDFQYRVWSRTHSVALK